MTDVSFLHTPSGTDSVRVKYRDQGDGTHAEVVSSDTSIGGKMLIGGARDKWRDSFESLNHDLWDYVSGIYASDTVAIGGNSQGSGYAEIILDYLGLGRGSGIKGKATFAAPYRLGYGLSISQRAPGEMVVVSLAAVDASGNRIQASGEAETYIDSAPTSVSKIVVSGGLAHITFSAPHNLKYDDLCVVSGAADNRINLQGRVSTVVNRYMVRVATTITSATYAVGASCKITKIAVSKGSSNVIGIAYMDSSSTNAFYFSRADGSPEFLSPNTAFSTAATDALVPVVSAYAVNMQPRVTTEIVGAMDVCRWMALPSDSSSAGTYFKRTQALPNPALNYSVFVDVVALPNRNVPVEIDSVVKAGTTTATVNTVAPHGLVSGSFVRCLGARDQTSMPNMTAEAAITVTSLTQFTLVWGTAHTLTYYGGVVVPASPSGSATGCPTLATAVQGTAWHAGLLYVGLSGSQGLIPGDIIRLVGVQEVGGGYRADLGGRFRVIAINPNVQEGGVTIGAGSTTGSAVLTMTDTGSVPVGAILTGTGLAANSYVSSVTNDVSLTLTVNATATGTGLLDITLVGVALEPVDFSAPADSQPLTTLSAGAVVRETSARLHFMRCLDHTRTPVEVTGGSFQSDPQQSVSIYTQSSIPVSQSSSAAVGTDGAGAWPVRGAPSRVTDSVSAANTVNGVGAAIALSNTGSTQFNCDVTAVSGTSPRMVIRVQGSHDSANWLNIYDIGSIFAVGSKNHDSPVIPTEFNWIRYSSQISGTTPSFTRSLNRTNRPMETSRRQRRMVDQVLALTALTPSTEWLYAHGCRSAQVVCTPLTGATTVPQLKVQACSGDPTVAANWYDVPSSALTTSASSTAATDIIPVPHAKFLRLVPTVAGVGVATGYDLVLSAWE